MTVLIFKFIGDRTDVVYLQTYLYKYYIVCKYATSVQFPMNLKIKIVIS
jgi:hypothetical protein